MDTGLEPYGGISLMLPTPHAQASTGITFDQPVHFMTTEGRDGSAPGNYRLEPEEQDRLRLLLTDGVGEVLPQAIGTTHDKQIDDPVTVTLNE